MKRWLTRIGKRALLVGVILTVAGIATVQILRKLLKSQDFDVDMSLEFPIIFGLTLGVSGLILVFVFEAIAAGWQAMRGRKAPESPTTEATP